MAKEPVVTIVGRLGTEPEIRFSAGGTAVAVFTVASTPSKKEGDQWVDGTTLWMRCKAFGRLAEHVGESLSKGHPVIVTGRLAQDNWEDKEGNKRVTIEMTVEACGHDLNWVTTVPHKSQPAAPREPERARETVPAALDADDAPPF